METKEYISLEILAAKLRLPQSYLRNLVENSQIPALKVNGRLRFNFEAVEKALADIAAKGSGGDE